MNVLAELIPMDEYLTEELENYSLPEVCNRVRVLMDDDTASIEEIGNVIFLEPIIVARILKIANSPIFNLKNTVETLTDGLRILGLETTYRLLMAEFTTSVFRKLHNKSINMRRVWQQAFSAAIASHEIAVKFKLPKAKAESLYISALLHNIGELFVAQKNPNLARLVEIAMKGPTHPFKSQRQQCGFDYPTLSSKILSTWGFPAEIIHRVATLSKDMIVPNMSIEDKIFHVGVHCGICASMDEYYTVDMFFSDNRFELPEIDVNSIADTCRKAADESLSAIRIMDTFKASDA